MQGNPRKSRKNVWLRRDFGELLSVCALLFGIVAHAQAPPAKAVGTVKSIRGNSVILTGDSGSETTVTFADSARIVKAAPGQTDLKSAAPIQFSDIQVGDRVAARGQSAEGGSLIASVAIVMKKTDIAER